MIEPPSACSLGTRAIVDVTELQKMGGDPAETMRLVDYLVQSRLLVVQTRSQAEGAAVEIVHESLITKWPTLRLCPKCLTPRLTQP